MAKNERNYANLKFEPRDADGMTDDADELEESGPQAMEESEIVKTVEDWRTNAINEDEDELSEEREQVLDYYRMEPYGDEEEGYSSAVTAEVLETVEWALPSIVRTFLGGNAVQFRGVGSEDAKAALQETKLVNWKIRNHDDAFFELVSWFKDCLLYPNAYLKVWWDERQAYTFEEYEGLTEEQVNGLAMDGEVMELETEVREMVVAGPDGQPITVKMPVASLVLRVEEFESRLMLAAVPPEEVLVSSNFTGNDLDKADFVVHEPTDVTRSDLIAMGYDYDLVMSLKAKSDDLGSTERSARRATIDENSGLSSLTEVEMMERVDYVEAYGRIDQDGDGYAEYRKLCIADDHLLESTYCEFQPFCTLVSILQPHRHVGLSLGSVAMKIQRENSALTRQGLDNLYRTNRPRAILGRSINREQWDNYQPHAGVEGNPADYAPEIVPVAVQHILPWMQYQDDRLQSRTGISKHSMGLDSDVLAKSTLGAYLEASGASSQRLELVIRCIAELGFAQMVRKVHALLRKHQNIEEEAEVDGQWVPLNPREWKKRTNIVPSVGTGNGSTRERAMAAETILAKQVEAIQYGLSDYSRIYTTLGELAAALGKHDAEAYFIDPSSPEGMQAQQRIQAGQAQEQARMQAMVEQQVSVQVKQIEARFAEQMAKLGLDRDKFAAEDERKWAEMELGAAVDVLGKGVSGSDVVAFPSANPKPEFDGI